jgi:putative thioredoxin
MRTAAAMTGAVDLSALKAQADARAGAPAAGGPAGGPVAVVAVTEANFTTAVVEESDRRLVVVELRSRRSQASAALSPVLEKLAADDGGRWCLATVDIDVAPTVGQVFGASTVPTTIAVAAGRPVTAFAGPQPEDVVRGWLDDVLAQLPPTFGAPAEEGPEVDPRVEAAELLAEQEDYDGARAAYRAILNSEPDNTEARDAIRRLDFVARATTADPAAVQRSDADPADVDAALEAADRQLLTGDTAAAFARLITAIARSAGPQRDTARARLLQLFELFDPADETVLAARRRLAAALY